MQRLRRIATDFGPEMVVGILAGILFVLGYFCNNTYACCASGACLLLLVRRWTSRRNIMEYSTNGTRSSRKKLAEPQSPKDLTQRLLDQGRSALLLRPEVYKRLDAEQRKAAEERLESDMAQVSAGKIWMSIPSKQQLESGAPEGTFAHTVDILVDRCAVTNHEYQQFVDDGGYDNEEHWCDTSVRTRSQFVDASGENGPRFWRNGQFPTGEGHLPVVGVSWYEAQAFARWAGKRLPSGPEWVKSALAPNFSASVPSQQHHFPWGDAVNSSQANLWQTAIGRPVSVTDFSSSANHDIYQMVGNVWEWNDDKFATWQPDEGWNSDTQSLKSIRGGAYDTYLESQAACTAQSAEEPFARRHNIGFRCVADPGQLVL